MPLVFKGLKRVGKIGGVGLVLLACLGCAAEARAAPETKDYVIGWWGMATYYGGDSDCPNGLNPMSTEFYRRELLRLGYTPDQATDLLKGFPGIPGTPDGAYIKIVSNRGRIDGKPVNVYEYPTSVPDPGLKTVEGKLAYGFDLDGKVDSPISFTDPDTGEQGVKNQLYRAVGCIRSHRAVPPNRPNFSESTWDRLRDSMGQWVISIVGFEEGRDDYPVDILIDKVLEPLTRDSSGHIQSGMTYRLDPDPRSHNRLHARVKGGMITTTEPGDVRLIGDPWGILQEYHFEKAQLRLKLNPDGTLKGVLGGYLPWFPIYFSYASPGWTFEHSYSVDMPGLYYALRRLADADPDKNGQNQSISSSYEIEAVPAFVIRPQTGEQKTAGNAQPKNGPLVH